MRKSACLLFVAVLLAASVTLAASRVTNVEMNFENGNTAARVDIDGTVRFTHQTEVARDGRPFRVIVDILAATHHLGRKEFIDLPSCVISGIRTSQYSVKPEQVVRLVFDMQHETVYRVQSDAKSVTVVFPDKTAQPFAAWSSSAWLATQVDNASAPTVTVTAPKSPVAKVDEKAKPSEKTAGELNAAFDRDRQLSLVGKTKSSKPSVSIPAMVSSDEFYGPVFEPDDPVASEAASLDPVEQKAPVKKAAKPVTVAVTPPAEKKQEATKPVQEKPKEPLKFKNTGTWADQLGLNDREKLPVVVAAPETIEPPKTEKPVVIAAVEPEPQKTVPAKPAVKPTTKANTPKVQTPKAEPQKAVTKPTASDPKSTSSEVKQAPEKAPVEKDPSTESRTSRFRRTPAFAKKIKGTMVAEFPKRLLMKYRATDRRDPFETLINDAKVYSSPVEQRVPNVEGLRLVGIIESSTGANSALFEDTDGYGYILNGGDRVQKGYVLRVESDKVYFQIFEYGWSRTVALRIEE